PNAAAGGGGEPALQALEVRARELSPRGGVQEVVLDHLRELEEWVVGEQPLLDALAVLIGLPGLVAQEVAPQALVVFVHLRHPALPGPALRGLPSTGECRKGRKCFIAGPSPNTPRRRRRAAGGPGRRGCAARSGESRARGRGPGGCECGRRPGGIAG